MVPSLKCISALEKPHQDENRSCSKFLTRTILDAQRIKVVTAIALCKGLFKLNFETWQTLLSLPDRHPIGCVCSSQPSNLHVENAYLKQEA